MKNQITTNQKYDIIGDIHGHAAELEALLELLGYNEKDGHYQHPEGRKVIFLGDYIDRGPEIRRVLQIVRGMIDDGEGYGILGNHEVNALRFHTGDGKGGFLRPRTERNTNQHCSTLSQIAEPFPDEWFEWLDWFSELPLWLELGPIRVVHASWNSRVKGHLEGKNKLSGEVLQTYSLKNTEANQAISIFINGPEARLPDPHSFRTHDGIERFEIRIKWWSSPAGKTVRDIAFEEDLPGIPDLPPKEYPAIEEFNENTPITFFGHYAIKDKQPKPILPNLACLDYGMGKGGHLVAYRWDGETQLDASKFVAIPQR